MRLIVTVETQFDNGINETSYYSSVNDAVEQMKSDNQFSRGTMTISSEGSQQSESFIIQKQVIYSEITRKSEVQLLMEAIKK